MALVFIIGFIVCDIIWWRFADRRLKAAHSGKFPRIVMGLFLGSMLGYVVIGMTPLSVPIRKSQGPLPPVAHATVYLWHFVVLPVITLPVVWRALRRRLKRKSAGLTPSTGTPGEGWGGGDSHNATGGPHPNPPPAYREREPESPPTRRQVLSAAALSLPPMAAMTLGTAAIQTLYGRRLRSFNVTLPQLPRELDGMTIAHVSDTHIGKFFHPDRLPSIAEDINKLDADFIVFTGDLIDLALDDLRFGVQFLRSLKSRCGMAICEGNHDLMEQHGLFRKLILETGLPFISDHDMTLFHTSRDGIGYPVQFIASRWDLIESDMLADVPKLYKKVRGDAFPILLAHHPHCWDPAAESGFPLVLSGHTHGGQIMLNDQQGLGKLRFRYTSGLYRKPGSSLIVNNGLGNWFPIRINAPAELVHITLRSGV